MHGRTAYLGPMLFTIVAGLFACGGGSTAGGGGSGADDGGGGSGDPAPVVGLQTRIDDAVNSLWGDTCFAQADTSQCEWADYEVGPAQFNMARSTGESILIIDDFGAGFFPELVRYRNRILGFYRVNGDQIAPEILSVHLPKRLGDVMISFAGPEFIPADALAAVAVPTWPVYGKLNLLYYGHGGEIFTHLVELVPEHPLVLLDLNHLFDLPPVVCDGVDDRTLAAATTHFAAVAASLAQVMTEQHARFINASFGDTTSTVAANWPRACAGDVPDSEQLRQLVHIYDPVYDVLFHSEGVVAAHAAANLGDPADFPFDQVSPRYSNRVRVGFISSRDSGLDEVGRGAVRKAEQFPVDGDADVYFNWGCEGPEVCADLHYRGAGVFGFASGTLPLMSTSYITPLGLARLANLRQVNHAAEPMSDALVQALKRELTPALCGADAALPCVYQDPIAHRQLELYRLGYE